MMNAKVSLSSALGLLAILSASSAQAISLSFAPVSQSVTLGQSAQVTLNISDLGTDTLGTFDLTIAFDPTVVAFSNASFGDPILGDQLDWTPWGVNSRITPDSSTVNLYEVSLVPNSHISIFDNQAKSFRLANLTFNTLNTGTSALTLSKVTLGDANGALLIASLEQGSLTVKAQPLTPIPESSSPIAIFVSLLGCYLLGSQRKSRTK